MVLFASGGSVGWAVACLIMTKIADCDKCCCPLLFMWAHLYIRGVLVFRVGQKLPLHCSLKRKMQSQ